PAGRRPAGAAGGGTGAGTPAPAGRRGSRLIPHTGFLPALRPIPWGPLCPPATRPRRRSARHGGYPGTRRLVRTRGAAAGSQPAALPAPALAPRAGPRRP